MYVCECGVCMCVCVCVFLHGRRRQEFKIIRLYKTMFMGNCFNELTNTPFVCVCVRILDIDFPYVTSGCEQTRVENTVWMDVSLKKHTL